MREHVCMCVCVGILSSLLQAAGLCVEEEKPLQPMTHVPQHTDCLMFCTGMTYLKMLQLQDRKSIRMRDSTEGELGEYCWPSELTCTTAESFLSASVVLPVDVSTVRHEQLKVKVTDPATAAMLQGHVGASTLVDSCGLRYDVTQHFTTTTRSTGTSFCIQVLTHEDAPGEGLLKCPPFLVTIYLKDPSNQQSGG